MFKPPADFTHVWKAQFVIRSMSKNDQATTSGIADFIVGSGASYQFFCEEVKAPYLLVYRVPRLSVFFCFFF